MATGEKFGAGLDTDRDEVRALCNRVLAAIKLLSPIAYHSKHVWVEEFQLTCTAAGWTFVNDERGSQVTRVFTAWRDSYVPMRFSWDPVVCREVLVPALDRLMVLDDLASL